MGESLPRHRQPAPSRLGMRSGGGGGEIVEVQGGHIVRSTGRKDRHSKVCTAKGPRDRRVRLSAHTAIQFYDVQDRLGYDRPSKAVDWLITKARAAIDDLAQLPPWNPTSVNLDRERETPTSTAPSHQLGHPIQDNTSNQFGDNPNPNPNSNNNNNDGVGGGGGGGNNNSGFLPQSMDSDAIADTIKSFFPMGAASAEHDSGGADYPTQYHSQDLRLSLQSAFENPIFSLHHHQPPAAAATENNNSMLGYEHGGGSSGWADFQRMVGYYSATGDYAPVAAPLVFGHHQQQQQQQQQQQFGSSSSTSTQRGPLQSSNTQSIRAWIDPLPPPSMSYVGGGGEQNQSFPMHHHHAFQGFSGFRVPARIRGDEEEHDGDKPSSASSDSLSRH